MSKRFTETTKWDNAWFRKLRPVQKCFWLYLVDRCDQAGVIEPDYEMAAFFIGSPVTDADLAALAENVRVLPTGKLWLPKFVRFQYGTLSRDCKPHLPVFAALAKHGLTEADVIAPEKASAPPPPAPVKTTKQRVETEAALAIYSLYPRKEGKQEALKAITKALAIVDAKALLAATEAYARAVALWSEEDRRFIPHPATWFNKGKYEDDPATWVRSSTKNNHRYAVVKGADHAKGF